MTATLLDAALALAAADIPVFPLRITDKRPVVKGGFHVASTDPDVIARMFADPAAGLIGVPTGPASGFDVLDIDPGKGGMEWLEPNRHRIPSTRVHHTRSSGIHFVLRHARGLRNSASKIAPGVDIRAEGGYVVWWPAAGFYAEGSVWAEWPTDLLIEAMRRQHREGSAPAPGELAPPSTADLITLLDDMPNPSTITRDDYVSLNLAVQGCLRALDALNSADAAEADDVRDAAARWCSRWQSDHVSDYETERERWDRDWSLRTNDVSGWRHVLNLAERCGLDTGQWRHAAAVAEFGTVDEPAPAVPAEPSEPAAAPADAARNPTEQAAIPEQPSVEEPTETAVARGFGRDMSGRLAFDHSAREWRIWDSRSARWRADETESGIALILEYVRQTRALFGGNAVDMARVRFASAVERAARSDPRIAVAGAVWDRDPWLIGVPGGVVDLRTGATSPGNPALHIYRQCAVAPAPAGTRAPLWDSFLGFATGGDVELQAWLQRLTGYCLTGDVSEEIFAFLYGSGGNGKGTFLESVLSILGAYAVKVPIDVFSAGARVNLEYYRATMAGARVVWANETESAASWAESAIKELTGNEGELSARAPYGKPFTFRPQAKLLIVGNHAPRLRGHSDAMERRLRVVPFEHTPSRPDGTLKERLRAEYPAILRWMIDGCLAWESHRLGTCAVIQRASGAYFEEQDTFGRWADERLERGAGLQAKRTDLFNDYSVWSRNAGETPIGPAEFYEAARRRLGAEGKTIKGVRYLRGVELKAGSSNVAAPEFPAVSAIDTAPLVH